MANKKDNKKDENLQRYLERLKGYQHGELITPTKEMTLDELAVEGHLLLAQESILDKSEESIGNKSAKDKAEAYARAELLAKYSPSTIPPTVSKDNPYLQAREQLFAKYPTWRKNEVLYLEKIKDLDNPHYLTYVQDVIELGNYLSYNTNKK